MPKKNIKVLLLLGSVVLLCVLISICVSLQLFLGIGTVQTIGNMMKPSFPNGSYLVTVPISSLNRGDVVVFKDPKGRDIKYIARIIGLPDESVKLESGKVFINNVELDETSYLNRIEKVFGGPAGASWEEGQAKTLQKNQYFVLGDNSINAIDSRFLGPVSKNAIVSKVAFCYWACK